jgi:hypothetical protein
MSNQQGTKRAREEEEGGQAARVEGAAAPVHVHTQCRVPRHFTAAVRRLLCMPGPRPRPCPCMHNHARRAQPCTARSTAHVQRGRFVPITRPRANASVVPRVCGSCVCPGRVPRSRPSIAELLDAVDASVRIKLRSMLDDGLVRSSALVCNRGSDAWCVHVACPGRPARRSQRRDTRRRDCGSTSSRMASPMPTALRPVHALAIVSARHTRLLTASSPAVCCAALRVASRAWALLSCALGRRSCRHQTWVSETSRTCRGLMRRWRSRSWTTTVLAT